MLWQFLSGDSINFIWNNSGNQCIKIGLASDRNASTVGIYLQLLEIIIFAQFLLCNVGIYVVAAIVRVLDRVAVCFVISELDSVVGWNSFDVAYLRCRNDCHLVYTCEVDV